MELAWVGRWCITRVYIVVFNFYRPFLPHAAYMQ